MMANNDWPEDLKTDYLVGGLIQAFSQFLS